MTTFLFTSFVSFLVVTLAVAVKPSQLRNNPIEVPGIGSIDLHANAKRLFRRILIGLLIALLLFAIWWEVSLERATILNWTPNVFFGLIFGPVFAIWLASLIRNENGKFTVAQSVTGAVLIALFVTGLLGAETSRYARLYLNRIERIGIGGAEFKFFELSQSRQEDSDRFTAKLPPGYKSLEELPGLQNLANLDLLMDRDCEVMARASNLVRDCVPNYSKLDATESTKDKQKWTSEFGAAFARLSISGYARCLGGLYAQTLDDGFVTDRLQPFADLFRELLYAPKLDKGFPTRAVTTHLRESRELLRYMWPVFFSGNDSRGNSLRSSCAYLLQSFCDSTIEIPVRLDDNKKADSILASAQEWVERPTSLPVLEACRQSIDRSPTDAIESDLRTVFQKFYEEDLKNGFQERPYLAIAVASIFFQLERFETGLSFLSDWIDTYERENLSGENLKRDPHKIWYAIRARNVLYIYMDKWIADLDTGAPTVVRNMHIQNLQRYLALLQIFPPSARLIANLNVQKYDLDKYNYRFDVGDIPACRQDEDAKIILTHLSTGNLFAYHALRHRKYGELYETSVRKIVRDSMNADMSCIAMTYTPQDAAAFRSEALVLQAEILINDAEQERPGNPDESRALLIRADAAVKLAVQMIDQAAKQDEKLKAEDVRFLQKIGSTKALIAKETALRTGDKIKNAIARVGTQ